MKPILIQIGPLTVYWYGLLIVLGMLAATVVVTKLGKKYRLNQDVLLDAMFWSILSGIIGARLYHVFLELPYYRENLGQIPQIWKGGLAIHGGIIAGLIALLIYTKKKKLDFWLVTAIFAPAVALAQTIGRWGNFFNQELYGRPTDLPWGIPIELANRLPSFENFTHFHPTFLYESIGNLIIFIILIFLHKKNLKNSATYSLFLIPASYLILYSLLRFTTEFIRIDTTPSIIGLRFPQLISLIIIIIALIFLYRKRANFRTLYKN